jgi:hypothetical protein
MGSEPSVVSVMTIRQAMIHGLVKNGGFQLNMSNSISTLLTRNLQEVFGENDPARRRAAVHRIGCVTATGEQHRRKRSRPLAHRPAQGPSLWGFPMPTSNRSDFRR